MSERLVRIRIVFADPEASSVHRIRNMGEELWSRMRDDRRYRIDLAEVDRAVGKIDFAVRDTVLKRAVAIVGDVLAEHMMTAEARIEIAPAAENRGDHP